MDEIPVFRANKRRKVVRDRITESDADADLSDRSSDRDELQKAGDADSSLVSDLVKLRKQNRYRSGGVRFSKEARSGGNDEITQEMALIKVGSDEEKLKNISNRFVGSTGQVVDDDKHMMAYVDSEMAKRHNVASGDLSKQHVSHNLDGNRGNTDTRLPMATPGYRTQSQLSEFDLGQDSHERNLARTEAAIAQAQSGLPVTTEEPKPRKPRKPRLGRDGKPLRPRARKRRNSGDVARDALVEQMLHEHKVATYDGEERADSDTREEDEDADERLAEQFKQDFLDAMAERQQKNQVKAATAARAKGMGPEKSGPKLGGSRSMRAKMAQMQQNTQQKGATQK